LRTVGEHQWALQLPTSIALSDKRSSRIVEPFPINLILHQRVVRLLIVETVLGPEAQPHVALHGRVEQQHSKAGLLSVRHSLCGGQVPNDQWEPLFNGGWCLSQLREGLERLKVSREDVPDILGPSPFAYTCELSDDSGRR